MSDISLAEQLLDAPVLAPLDVRFANGARGDAGAALFFERPNAMALEIVNRTIHDMSFAETGDAHHLELAFRPHTLLAPEQVRLAPSSIDDGWSLAMQDPAEHGHRQVYRLTRRAGEVLAAGATEHVHLEAVRADPFGGARGTQASVDYAGIGLGGEGAPLSGHLLLRLALLDAGDTGGASAAAGDEGASDLFRARFSDGGATLLNDGTENRFRIGVVNDSGGPLELRGGDDTAARFVFDLDDARHHGKIDFAVANGDDDLPDGWEGVEDGTAVRPRAPYRWENGHYLWFRATMSAEINHGRHPLRIRYENMPPEGLRGGAITLMQQFGPLAQTNGGSHSSGPLDFLGADGELRFSHGDPNVSKVIAARLSASQDEATKGRLTIRSDSEHGVEVAAARLSLTGGRLGIGKGAPEAPIHIQEGVSDTALSGGGGLVIGAVGGTNVSIDNNGIMARDGGAISRLAINWDGGDVNVGGKLALGQGEPEAPVHVQGGFSDAEPSGGGGIVVGPTSGANLAIDDNEIMARDAGKTATLHLNADGGLVHVGGEASVDGALSADSVSARSPSTIASLRSTSVSVDGRLSARSVSVGDALTAGAIEITGTDDVEPGSGRNRSLLIGDVRGVNLALDSNEIMARNRGEASTLYLNADGGTVFLGNGSSHGQFQGTLGVVDVPVWNGTNDNDVTWSDDKVICREGSSKRYKKNIRTLKDDFDLLLKVRPRRFEMKKGFGDPEVEMIGYVAEELNELGLERLVDYDEEGRPDGVKYKKLAIYLTEVVKTQESRIAALETAVAKLSGTREPNKKRAKAPARRSTTVRKGGG